MRILIVEDDALLGDGLASGLRALGFAVDWFRDAGGGDAALAQAPYDAVILDLGLPGQDGMACLARWRARGETTPVLVLTARDSVPSRIGGLDAGADDYLIKPIALQELAARLRAVTPQTAFFVWVYSRSVRSTAVLPVISCTLAYSGAAPGASR